MYENYYDIEGDVIKIKAAPDGVLTCAHLRDIVDECANMYSMLAPYTIEICGDINRISENAFSFESNIKKVILSKCVRFPNVSFFKCNDLESIELNNSSIDKILRKTFYGCYKLKNIKLSNRTTVIEERAFGFTGLETIVIPKTVKTLGEKVFECCNNLKRIYITRELIEGYGEAYISRNSRVEIIPYDEIEEAISFPKNEVFTEEKIVTSTTEVIPTNNIVTAAKTPLKSFNGVIRKNAENISSNIKSNQNSSKKSYCGVIRNNLLQKKK